MNEKYSQIKENYKKIYDLKSELVNTDKKIAKILFKQLFDTIENLRTLSWTQKVEYNKDKIDIDIEFFTINGVCIYFNGFGIINQFFENLRTENYFFINSNYNSISLGNGSKTLCVSPEFSEEFINNLFAQLKCGEERIFYWEEINNEKELKIFKSQEEYDIHVELKYRDMRPLINQVLKFFLEIYEKYGQIFFINVFGVSSEIILKKDLLEISNYEGYCNNEDLTNYTILSF